MEYEYHEYRKDSQRSLNDKEVSGKEKLSNYEAKEEKRKEGKEPKEKLLLENTYGTVNFGISDKQNQKREDVKQERLITISKKREKDRGSFNHEKTLKETGAATLKSHNRRGFTNMHDKENSAVGLRVLSWHSGEKIVEQIQNLAEKENLQVVKQMLPFLAEKKEKDQIEMLQEKKRKEGGLEVEKEKYLELLNNNQIHRQQKKKELIASLNKMLRSKEKQEGKEKKKRSKEVEFIWELLNDETDVTEVSDKEDLEDV